MEKIEAIRRRVRCLTGRHAFTRWIPAVVLYRPVEVRSCHWCGCIESRWGTEPINAEEPAQHDSRLGDRLAGRVYRGAHE